MGYFFRLIIIFLFLSFYITCLGVFFRKYTQKTAKELGLVGWVKNTDHDTVVGTIQGDQTKITEM